MNENDENVDPMNDAAPDVEHLRLEISENGEVFYHIDDVTLMMLRRCQQLLFSFFCEKREEEKAKEVFFFKVFLLTALFLVPRCSFPNKRKTITIKFPLVSLLFIGNYFSTSRKLVMEKHYTFYVPSRAAAPIFGLFFSVNCPNFSRNRLILAYF